jgi:hypothetical protein
MTTTTILIVSAIASAFLLFGGVLAWGDFYTRGRPDDQLSLPDKTVSPAEASTKRWSEAA